MLHFKKYCAILVTLKFSKLDFFFSKTLTRKRILEVYMFDIVNLI